MKVEIRQPTLIQISMQYFGIQINATVFSYCFKWGLETKNSCSTFLCVIIETSECEEATGGAGQWSLREKGLRLHHEIGHPTLPQVYAQGLRSFVEGVQRFTQGQPNIPFSVLVTHNYTSVQCSVVVRTYFFLT